LLLVNLSISMPSTFPKPNNKIFSVFLTRWSGGGLCKLWNAWKSGLGGRKWCSSWDLPSLHSSSAREPGSSAQAAQLGCSGFSRLQWTFFLLGGEGSRCFHPTTRRDARGKLPVPEQRSRAGNWGGQGCFPPLWGHGGTRLCLCRFFRATNGFFSTSSGSDCTEQSPEQEYRALI